MSTVERNIEVILCRFLQDGYLPKRLPRFLEGLRENDKAFDEAIHFLNHVITDIDIRMKDPEVNEAMLKKLGELIEDLNLDCK